MKRAKRNGYIVGLGTEDRYYLINGMWYIVSSQFAPPRPKREDDETLSDKLQNYIGGDFADLTPAEDEATLDEEYACSAAGEEDL
ncbi:MAG: hypothetical protein K5981_06890 [Clostridia bacterium]|nr:hypothetical protein [Clostridia bacterium]